MFYSNGILSKICQDKVKKSVDLKFVVKEIQIKTANEFIQNELNDKHKTQTNLKSNSNTNSNIVSKRNSLLNKLNITKKQSNNSDTSNGTKLKIYISDEEELILDLVNAMVMTIPIRYGAKKYWYLIFPNFERLT